MDLKNFGKRLKSIRKSHNITQKDFSEHFGVNQGHVSKIEREVAKPSLQLIKAICSAFNLNEKWLTAGKGPKQKVSSPEKTQKEMESEFEKAYALKKDEILELINDAGEIIEGASDKMFTIITAGFEFDPSDIDSMVVKKRFEHKLFGLLELYESIKVKQK